MEEKAYKEMEETLANIRNWMNTRTNRLKMNDSNNEFITFGTRQQLHKLSTSTLDVNDTLIKASDMMKYLGVHLDKILDLKLHITTKCKVASFNCLI